VRGYLSVCLSYLKSAPTSLSASPNHLSISVPALMLMKVAPHSDVEEEEKMRSVMRGEGKGRICDERGGQRRGVLGEDADD
jgi:hypothetical protein